MSIIQGTSKAAGGYTIDQSIMFNNDDSAYLYRTPSGDGNLKTFTINLWIKISSIDTDKFILEAKGAAATGEYLAITSTNQIQLYGESSGANCNITTTQLFRDPSAWAMLTAAVDTTQATTSNRIKLYYNGEQITSFSTANYPTLDRTFAALNKGSIAQNLGRYGAAGSGYYDGYITEFCFIDGQALDASSFGQLDVSTNRWIPKDVSGLTFGTNGFYLDMETAPGTGSGAGTDSSGNSNNFTESGLTASDQVDDSPTKNFATWNPLEPASLNGDPTFSNGNRTVTINGAGADAAKSSIAIPTSGKWYFEATATIGAGNTYIGIADKNGRLGDGPASCRGYASNGNKDTDASASAYGATFATNDIIGVAVDMDSGTIEFYKNNTSQGIAFTDLITAGVTWFINCRLGTGGAFLLNTGQTAFAYTPPTGFKRLCTANLSDPTIADPSAHFQTTLYTGNGTAIGSGGNEVNQSGNSTFQPDFVWIKNRSATDNHMLYDAVRGATKDLHSNTTDAEATDTEGLSTFDADGFTVGSNVEVNTSSENYVAWQWKANGTGSSNTDGSVTTTASVNTTAKFSIATFQKPAADTNETVGHGLGVTPAMTILKWRSGTGGASTWYVWHQSFSSVGFLRLQGTDAFTSDTTIFSSAPSSTVVNLGTAVDSDTNTTEWVMYNFAEVEGFSKFGSYTGNGSTDGTFVYSGFRPAFVMTKRTNSTSNWAMWDTARDTFNVANKDLAADAVNAEPVNTIPIDILSNGFKLRTTGNPNASGGTYVYMAFAESPFKTANAR